MESEACLIGLDLGTSATKGVLVARGGRLLAEAGAPTVLRRPREGWVEADAEQRLHAVLGVIRRLAAAAPGPVAALAFCAASGNTLLTDADGRPLTPILNWMDRRAVADSLPDLEGIDAAAHHATAGWPWLRMFPLAHLAWLRRHRPGAWRTAAHMAMDTDWLVRRLTGQWRSDRSTATTSYLYDQVGGGYHGPTLNRLRLGEARLSPLADIGEPVGRLTPEAAAATGLDARVLMVAGSFDHPSAARAVGVLDPGDLLLSCGTSWVGLAPCADRATLLRAGLLCDPFRSCSGGPWAGMFSVTALGERIDAYIHQVIAPGSPDPYAVFNAAAAEAPAGAGGLRIDLMEPARPMAASVACISRGVMEAAARLLAARMPELEAYGLRFDRAVMVGGPSQSPIWPGILAEATGLDVRVGGRSAGALGAAMLAGIGAGWWPAEAAAPRPWGAMG